jgi:hypothetical protein
MRVVPKRVNKNDIAHAQIARDFASRTRDARQRCLRHGENAASDVTTHASRDADDDAR